MIHITDKSECCGCGACENICNHAAISMVEDSEGFKYPKVDVDLCVECGLCEKVCPILNPIEEKIKEQKAFIFQNLDEKIRAESTSGGGFTSIASYIIEKGGIVFGAAFDENYEVKHIAVDKIEDLYKFRGSKYVQSLIGNTYSLVKQNLKKGILVCFSGTPCQIEGLVRFLRVEYSNLILVDIVCHAVPSPLLFRKYVKLNVKKFGSENIYNIKFRDKINGYKYSNFSIRNKSNELIYNAGVEKDFYLRAFFSNISDRPSCYDCKFKKKYRLSDITMWDCYDVSKFNKDFDDDKGVTRLLVHSEKGRELINNIQDNSRIFEIDSDKAVECVKEMFESVSKNSLRDDFFKDLNEMEIETCLNKYVPYSFLKRTEHSVKVIFLKLGCYKFFKESVKKILNK